MWNTTDINTPASGIIQKSNKDSFFLHFHKNSQISDMIFNDSNPRYDIKGERKVIAVLQILTNENYFIVEIVDIEKL